MRVRRGSGRGPTAPPPRPAGRVGARRQGGPPDEPVEPAASSSAGSPGPTSSRFTSRALVLLLVVAVLGVSYASSIRAWLNQRNEEQTLSAQIAAAKAQIAQLRTDKERWNDPAFIEAQARLRFGWVMPGERSYRVIGANGKVLTAGHARLPQQMPPGSTSSPPWWQGAVDSYQTADSPPSVDPKKKRPVHHPATFIGPHGDRAGR